MPLLRAPLAVVFDMDGVLIDSEPLHREAILSSCRALGYAMTSEQHLQMIGAPWDRNRVRLAGWFGAEFPAEAFLADCSTRFRALAADGVPLRPGVRELVAFLDARGIPSAVATSAGRATATQHLSRTGLLDGFRAVVTRDDVSRGKPDPDVFLLAAERLGVDPAVCLALEDSNNGVRAASAAGMMTVMVPDLLEPTPEIAALCVHVARDLYAVRALLQAATATVQSVAEIRSSCRVKPVR
jgi:HAD superfamily hydrolase (TIGR01509 family)